MDLAKGLRNPAVALNSHVFHLLILRLNRENIFFHPVPINLLWKEGVMEHTLENRAQTKPKHHPTLAPE